MYYTSFSEYMQEAMKFDIEEGKLLWSGSIEFNTLGYVIHLHNVK